MNDYFRIFLNDYARTISILNRSDYIEFSIFSFLSSPLWFFAWRLLNGYVHIPFLPDPVLYDLQVRSEIRFQVKRFIDQTLGALSRIETSFSALHSQKPNSSLRQLLETALDAVDRHQQKLSQAIQASRDKSSFFTRLTRQMHEPQTLESHARGERMRSQIYALNETVLGVQIDITSLESDLHLLRKVFGYKPDLEISSQDKSLGVSAALRSQTHPDLDMVYGTNITHIRSEIANLCKARNNQNVTSSFVYLICNVWNHLRMMSGFEDDLLVGVQRRWVSQRRQAIRRYKKKSGNHPRHIGTQVKSFVDYDMLWIPSPKHRHLE